jgi:hypothetical protein
MRPGVGRAYLRPGRRPASRDWPVRWGPRPRLLVRRRRDRSLPRCRLAPPSRRPRWRPATPAARRPQVRRRPANPVPQRPRGAPRATPARRVSGSLCRTVPAPRRAGPLRRPGGRSRRLARPSSRHRLARPCSRRRQRAAASPRAGKQLHGRGGGRAPSRHAAFTSLHSRLRRRRVQVQLFVCSIVSDLEFNLFSRVFGETSEVPNARSTREHPLGALGDVSEWDPGESHR